MKNGAEMKKNVYLLMGLFFCNQMLFPQIEGYIKGVSEADYQMIIDNLESTLGYECSTENIVLIDSVLKKLDSDGGFENPYNTLNQSFVFTYYRVTSSEEGYSKLSLGIIKDKHIIARLDTAIETLFSTSGEIKAVADINNDGDVDILVTRTLGVSPPPYEGYWVVSWNGSSLYLINDVNDEGESVIISPWDGITYVDVNGDGIYELVTEMEDENGVAKKIIYSWNGSKYGLWGNPPQSLPSGTYPRNNVDAVIGCRVTKNNSGNFKYSYSVTNQPASKQIIDEIWLDSPDTLREVGTSPLNWIMGGLPGKYFGWMAMPGFNVYLLQGKTEKSFGFESNDLPVICNSYIRGHNPSGSLLVNGQLDFDKFYHDVITNSKILTSIGSNHQLKLLSQSQFLDTLLLYTRQSVTLGWLRSARDNDCDEDESPEEGVSKNLEKRLLKARKELQRSDSSKARQEIGKFVKKVEKIYKKSEEAEKKKHDSEITMTSEAYALLKYNAEYLIEQLLNESSRRPKKGKKGEND